MRVCIKRLSFFPGKRGRQGEARRKEQLRWPHGRRCSDLSPADAGCQAHPIPIPIQPHSSCLGQITCTGSQPRFLTSSAEARAASRPRATACVLRQACLPPINLPPHSESRQASSIPHPYPRNPVWILTNLVTQPPWRPGQQWCDLGGVKHAGHVQCRPLRQSALPVFRPADG